MTHNTRSNLDAPTGKPSIEVDEASGRDMVDHAQRAAHAFGRTLAEISKTIIEGDHHPEHMKLGFDYGVSLAYLEVDMVGIGALAHNKLEQAGLGKVFDSITVDEGVYVTPPQPDADQPAPRATFQSSPTSTVRLYLHSTGV